MFRVAAPPHVQRGRLQLRVYPRARLDAELAYATPRQQRIQHVLIRLVSRKHFSGAHLRAHVRTRHGERHYPHDEAIYRARVRFIR